MPLSQPRVNPISLYTSRTPAQTHPPTVVAPQLLAESIFRESSSAQLDSASAVSNRPVAHAPQQSGGELTFVLGCEPSPIHPCAWLSRIHAGLLPTLSRFLPSVLEFSHTAICHLGMESGQLHVNRPDIFASSLRWSKAHIHNMHNMPQRRKLETVPSVQGEALHTAVWYTYS